MEDNSVDTGTLPQQTDLKQNGLIPTELFIS
jgi:hypothetical protein